MLLFFDEFVDKFGDDVVDEFEIDEFVSKFVNEFVRESVDDFVDEVVNKFMLGPTGNLRAPTMKIGNALLVGFNQELYDQVFA